MTLLSKYKKGQVLIIGIIFMVLILIFTSAIFSKVSGFISFGSKSLEKQQAIHLAEAGIDKALWQLKTPGPYAGEGNTQVGQTGTFTTTIADVSPNLKTITSMGCLPNCTAPRTKQTIKVNISKDAPQTISFNSAAQVGDGGINMQNNAKIIGTVHSLKTGSNSIQGINFALIEGDAYAAGTISTPRPIVTGTKYENQSSLPPMPTFNYQYWKDQAEAGGTTTCPPPKRPPPANLCEYISGITSLGPQKLIGDLKVSDWAEVILNGPLFITGNVLITDNASIKLNNDFGSNGTVLITDGTVITENNGKFIATNSTPPGQILVVTTHPNTDAALTVKNNSSNAIFYALEGGTTLDDKAQVSALVTKKLKMENDSEVTYNSALVTAQFTTNSSSIWKTQKGTYIFSNSP